MKPIELFNEIWTRADMLSAMHAYLSKNGTKALRPEELLRAEWIARTSALDLYIHELVAQRMLLVLSGAIPQTPSFGKFRVSTETAARMATGPASEAQAAFDLDIRQQFSYLSFQTPEKIADAVRLCSSVKLWTSVAEHQNPSESPASIEAITKSIKATLSLIADRRNKIAHEGDLQPSMPRTPWPISEADILDVRRFIQRLVISIDSVVSAADTT